MCIVRLWQRINPNTNRTWSIRLLFSYTSISAPIVFPPNVCTTRHFSSITLNLCALPAVKLYVEFHCIPLCCIPLWLTNNHLQHYSISLSAAKASDSSSGEITVKVWSNQLILDSLPISSGFVNWLLKIKLSRYLHQKFEFPPYWDRRNFHFSRIGKKINRCATENSNFSFWFLEKQLTWNLCISPFNMYQLFVGSRIRFTKKGVIANANLTGANEESNQKQTWRAEMMHLLISRDENDVFILPIRLLKLYGLNWLKMYRKFEFKCR